MPDIIYIFEEKITKEMERIEVSRETKIVEKAKFDGYDLNISYSVKTGKEFPEQVNISGFKLIDGVNSNFNATVTTKSVSINFPTGDRDVSLSDALTVLCDQILGLTS